MVLVETRRGTGGHTLVREDVSGTDGGRAEDGGEVSIDHRRRERRQ